MSLAVKLLRWMRPGERRRAERRPTTALSAYYWDGAEPRPRKVRDVSVQGMYLITEERWYPNTLVEMTLTRTDASAAANRVQSVRIMARVVHQGQGGVGLAFVYSKGTGDADAERFRHADLKTMSHFLNGLSQAEQDNTHQWQIAVRCLVDGFSAAAEDPQGQDPVSIPAPVKSVVEGL